MNGQDPRLERLDAANAFGAPLFRVRETPSTMEEARALARRGEPSGAAVIADFQSAGRGRFRDRAWSGERGGDLMFTVYLRLPPGEAAAFPLKVGLAACLTVESLYPGLSPRVKWPNDVLLEGAKLCGILCESAGNDYFAGVGMNCVRRAFPPGLRNPAVSLEEAGGSAPDRFALMAGILASLRRVLSDPLWLDALNDRLYGRGLPVRFLEGLPERGTTIEGILRGLGPGGELLIESEDGRVRACSSGEILR